MSFLFYLICIALGVGVGWFLWKRDTGLTLEQNAPVVNTSHDTSNQNELEEERDFLNAQFDLLLSKLDDDAKTNWRTVELGSLGDLEKMSSEKARLASKIKEFVGKVDKDTRRHVSSLEEESLGVISPIREQLESEEKSRMEVQESFDRLVGKLETQLQSEWEGLDEGSIGLGASKGEDLWQQKFESLLAKVAPEFQDWEELGDFSLSLVAPQVVEEEVLSTEDWNRSEFTDGPSWLLDSPGREADDLKQIWGVGPVLEKTLNSIGIYYFSQLAQLTQDEDITWVSEQIKTFPDRIERDQWVKQAKLLIEDPSAVMKKPY